MNGNLLIRNAAELITCSGFAARSGDEMARLDIIEDGAVVIENGMITDVGETGMVCRDMNTKDYTVIDASGKAVLPGFVDAHTHFVFGGYRAEEFDQRLRGDSYMAIMQRGGGILSTVRDTRRACKADLVAAGRKRLAGMLSFGVTTVEGKSGYGLDKETEIKQLEVMAALDRSQPVDIVKTFLGAHAVPEAWQNKPDDYISYLIDAVLPEVSERNLADYCDVFCEKNVFSIDQSRRLLESAGKLGLGIKLHADEIEPFGGAELAAEVAATSADHLLKASDAGIRAMAEKGVTAVLLPATAFGLKAPYARSRFMIDQGCAVALATDMNPGSCFTESIPLVILLATVNMGMRTEEAVMALTLNGAAAVGLADTIGSLDVGKKGDAVILEFPSYRYLPYHMGVNSVETVVKNGNIVYKKEVGPYVDP